MNIGSIKKTADTDRSPADEHLMEWIQEKKERPEAIRPFDRDTVARRHEEIRLLHTYNSNAIKGNTLTPYETKPVLDEGIRNGVAWHATRRALAQYIQKHGLK